MLGWVLVLLLAGSPSFAAAAAKVLLLDSRAHFAPPLWLVLADASRISLRTRRSRLVRRRRPHLASSAVLPAVRAGGQSCCLACRCSTDEGPPRCAQSQSNSLNRSSSVLAGNFRLWTHSNLLADWHTHTHTSTRLLAPIARLVRATGRRGGAAALRSTAPYAAQRSRQAEQAPSRARAESLVARRRRSRRRKWLTITLTADDESRP
jgi:hypothetical protein